VCPTGGPSDNYQDPDGDTDEEEEEQDDGHHVGRAHRRTCPVFRWVVSRRPTP
jgi:hypothetical protein